MDNISEIEALARLRHLCSRSEKSPKDIYDKLTQWNYTEDPSDILAALKAEDFVNENRYTQSFVNDKIKYSKWGKQKVKYHLKGKGITSEVIIKYLQEFPEDEYLKIVRAELEKKIKSIKDEDYYKQKHKLMSFGASRGYESEVLFNLADEILCKK